MGIKSLRKRSLSMTKLVQERGGSLLDAQEQARFERLVLPYLDAAFNLARWLLRKRQDAEDVTQEAMLRAYKFFPGFHGGDARAWLLQIVRNSCYTWIEKNRPMRHSTQFEEELYVPTGPTPEAMAIVGNERERLSKALEDLPARYREVLVLRELEGCSYKEIAEIAAMPIGSVMSTLSRARKQLQVAMVGVAREEAAGEL
jgi:RNA polymerase sigma-70 factor (ECF subfamily)